MRLLTVLFLFFASFLFCEDHIGQVQVNLNSPTYQEGVLYTHEGGTLKSEEIRIQAKNIRYTKKSKENQKWSIEASQDLHIRYKGKVFVGEKIEYDFEKKEGVIFHAVTQIGCWFAHSQEIRLHSDGTYELLKTSLTTCEGKKSLWKIHVKRATIKNHDIICARNAQVQILKAPIFWYPYFKAKLSTLETIPAYYSMTTGGSQGQRISLRYLAYSTDAFKSYLQLDFWFKKGPSGSIQFDYKAPNHPTTFQANNFIGYDKQAKNSPSGAAPTSMLKQRYVGELNSTIAEKLHINGQYERLSDEYVLETYFNRYYFLHTQRQTKLELSYRENIWLSYLRAKVRINRFQTVNQELPLFYFNLKPILLGSTPFISDASLNIGYLDYVFGSDIDNRFANYRSPRIEIKPRLYLPYRIGGLALLLKGEYIGVGYGQSPRSKAIWNTLGILSASANYKLSKIFNNKWRHTFEPYTKYQFMTKPTVDFNNRFFFDMDDAYAKINQLRFGIKNTIYTKHNQNISNPLVVDVYSYGFFNNTTIGTFIPRLYVDVIQRYSNLFLSFTYAQNLQHHKIDFANVRAALTLSEDFALSFLFMHRSAFDYKKANHDNFLLNVFRPQATLLASKLSDRRNIAQSKIYWRVLRDLIFEFESRQGWNRISSPPFNEMKFDVTFLLPCNWRLVFSPQRTISPDTGAKYIWRFHMSIQLGGRPPKDMSKPYIFW